ncbi:MAG: hypothetical protein Q9225_005227 [Loekoesia sp. 1 TL-2023]
MSVVKSSKCMQQRNDSSIVMASNPQSFFLSELQPLSELTLPSKSRSFIIATLGSLAAQINTHATALSQFLTEAKLPAPSFAPDAPPSPPQGKEFEQIQATRMSLVKAAQAIRDLALGPVDCITAFSDGVGHLNYLTSRKKAHRG